MAVYKTGSSGPEVGRIQTRLAGLGYYAGPIDRRFGGGTQAAVKAFQRDAGDLDVDGVVGPLTWKALFNRGIPAPALHAESIDRRCLALTGSFETGMGAPDCFAGLSGDFDGEGLSFGVLQWNFGQGSLQPLLAKMIAKHRGVFDSIFHEQGPVLAAMLEAPREDQIAFARSLQDPKRHAVNEPWAGMFRALGRTAEFQALETEAAAGVFAAAMKDCGVYGLKSQRALALLFDIRVQNGGIDCITKARILADFGAIPGDIAPSDDEVRKLRIVALRRAEGARPQWVNDVRARKLCIANGEGVVHGIHYDLEAQFGLGLAAA